MFTKGYCVCLCVACAAVARSLAVQTTLQPWSATIYHSILHYGLQPSITFLELPAGLCRNAAGSFPASSGGDPNFPASANSYGFGSYGGRAAENAVSTTYEAVRVHFAAELLLLGFIRKQQLTLNPHEGSRLVPGDVLVALSKRADGELETPATRRFGCYVAFCFKLRCICEDAAYVWHQGRIMPIACLVLCVAVLLSQCAFMQLLLWCRSGATLCS
jgi:hypothetical protein